MCLIVNLLFILFILTGMCSKLGQNYIEIVAAGNYRKTNRIFLIFNEVIIASKLVYASIKYTDYICK